MGVFPGALSTLKSSNLNEFLSYSLIVSASYRRKLSFVSFPFLRVFHLYKALFMKRGWCQHVYSKHSPVCLTLLNLNMILLIWTTIRAMLAADAVASQIYDFVTKEQMSALNDCRVTYGAEVISVDSVIKWTLKKKKSINSEFVLEGFTLFCVSYLRGNI